MRQRWLLRSDRPWQISPVWAAVAAVISQLPTTRISIVGNEGMPSAFIFTDTSAWYAYVDKSDAYHSAATQFIRLLTIPLITSTYILDEITTLIKAHLGHSAAVRFGEKLRQEQIAKLLRITEQDEQRAWEIFVQYHDKGFSFTDCTSFALMEQLQLDTAFAFDEHFRQYGKFVVVPS
jgi:uncharacterized protein